MEVSHQLDQCIHSVTAQLAEISAAHLCDSINRPGLKKQVAQLISLLRSAMYPQIFGCAVHDPAMLPTVIRSDLQRAAILLHEILSAILPKANTAEVSRITCDFIGSVAEITRTLETDVRAAYDGDPAARSEEEIMLAYPAFEAISIYRLAHRLYELNVTLLARMMTEYAHQITGIDIHPGATIGNYFFIDHGTGVVIGETCTIGDHVKLYQGVTLGAKSFEVDENGNPVKGIKRHPDIGNHVVIYAGATILGGNTVIGDHCVIGGNVWLMHSVPAGERVYYTNESKQS